MPARRLNITLLWKVYAILWPTKLSLNRSKIKLYLFFADEHDLITLPNSHPTFYWPNREFLSSNVTFEKPITENFQTYIGTNTHTTNEFSSIFTFEQIGFRVLFTGDTTLEILEKNASKEEFLNVRGINILKVLHHGSKNGLTLKFLLLADPALSVINVGRHNRYHHPSPEVLDFFNKLQKKYLRTDEQGDIEFWIN